MIADELALRLTEEFVSSSSRILDPFCGTARTLLAAADRGASCVGLDANPLAVLISRAKTARIDIDTLMQLVHEVPQSPTVVPELQFERGRKVRWFSSRAKSELSQLVSWINGLDISRGELYLLAAVLSATTREVSFCRKDQWKLHRMRAKERSQYKPSPLKVFRRRLEAFAEELRLEEYTEGDCRIRLGDSRRLRSVLRHGRLKKFNVVITSPPYGDSRTTVGYGGISSICLGVIRHLDGLKFSSLSEAEIDSRCLGGEDNPIPQVFLSRLKKYWKPIGKDVVVNRVANYLIDLEACCREIASATTRKAVIVLVVARRCVAGRRLQIDTFLRDKMQQHGFILKESRTRKILNKNTPKFIDRNGAGKFTRRIATMRNEIVLIFEKVYRRAPRIAVASA
jgi:site-specific DNA-methyltransferase (cytosine-N4-specific)